MRFGDLPFALALLLVGAVAAIGVVAMVRLGLAAWWPVGIVPSAVIAAVYLWGYHARPALDASETPADEFDDPVAEADRWERSGGRAPDEPTTPMPAEPSLPGTPPPPAPPS